MLGSRWGAAGAPRAARDEGGVFSTADSSLGGGLCCALLVTGTGCPRDPALSCPRPRPPPQHNTRASRERQWEAATPASEPAREGGAGPGERGPACPSRGTFRASPAPDGKLGTCCKAKLPKAVTWTSTRTVGSAEQVQPRALTTHAHAEGMWSGPQGPPAEPTETTLQ